MRSTITLNGINSNTIEGLLIQNLPPISKPLMRTQIEEIDGRDGDVITKLGFSAYNKEITIGLYGDFDINQIIQYFTSQGTVVFSNEPDKYYYYQIIDQIDFERLIRYRTATVTMHCQPFKYSTTEGTQVFDNSSNLLTIPNSTTTKNGITVTVNNNIMTVSGTASAATEFYIPIDTLSLSVGKYGLYALGSGTNPEACSLRVVYETPSNANSFGGNYVTLKNNQTVSLIANLSNAKTYNYVYLYIAANKAMDFTLNLSIEDAAQSVVTGEGNLITLEGTAFAPFDKFDLKGDTTQQTYSGKNRIFPQDIASTTSGGVTFSVSDGIVTLNGTSTGVIKISDILYNLTGMAGKPAFSVIPISGSWTGGNIGVRFYAGNTQTFVQQMQYDGIYFNSNTLSESQIQSITSGQLFFGSRNVFSNFKFRVMLTQSTAIETGYEPYVGGIPAPNPDYPQEVQVVTGEQTVTITDGAEESQEYTVDLGNIELCKIGTYQDYIYKSGDDWYIRKETTSFILDGTKGGFYSSWYYVNFSNLGITNVGGTSLNAFSSNFTAYDYGTFTNDATINGMAQSGSNFIIRNIHYSDAAGYQTWLASTLPKVYYPLATPTDTQITNTALIAQLEALVTDAHAYKNTTTLVSTSENMPHIMSVEVAKNNDATITNSGNTTAKPVMTVYGSGTVGIYLNGNQIFNVNIGNNQYITIDTANMEAYKDTTDNLMNRLVDGDYSNFVLQTGENQISFSGSVSKLEISNYSRWI